MKLLERVGRGLMDIEDGFALPPSAEGLEYGANLLRRVLEQDPDAWSPEDIEESGRDLIAYVLRYLDEGWSIDGRRGGLGAGMGPARCLSRSRSVPSACGCSSP
jgi:hypothetical protein